MKKLIIIIIVFIVGFFAINYFTAEKESTINSEVNFDLQKRSQINKVLEDAYVVPLDKKSVEQQDEPIFTGEINKPSDEQTGYLSEGDEINIIVDQPQQGTVLSSPFTISGEARVFEGVLVVQITNSAGDTLINETAKAHATDSGEFGPFKITLHYAFSSTKDGFIEIFSESARDGSKENLVKIPVKFE